MSEEKTEQPSETRLRDARKKGQVAKSADVVALVILFFAFLFIYFFSPLYLKKITSFIKSVYFSGINYKENIVLYGFIKEAFNLWFFLSIPLLLVAMLGALTGNLFQFGLLFSTHPLKLEWKKIDPWQGLKKLFSKNRLVELFKQLLKFSIVFLVLYGAIKDALKPISLLFRLPLYLALYASLDILQGIILRTLLCFLVIAGFDFIWQRYSFFKSLRMSKYELKKEYKQQEGDPLIKQERRRLQHEALESLLNGGIGEASVVITNPSHIAVVLKFDEEKDEVPVLMAKGIGSLAQLIVEEAKSHFVPIMRNVPLARDLMWLEVNEEIPKNLYDSVAEILTFVHELQEKNNENQRS